MTILRKYNEQAVINFSLFAPDGVDFVSDATFAAGDIVLMTDEGVEVNSTNLPVDEGTGYSLTLTAAEMSGARLKIYIVDQTDPKFWLDTSINLETYGNASAQHALDLDSAIVVANAVEISGDSGAATGLQNSFNGVGYDNENAPATQGQLAGVGATANDIVAGVWSHSSGQLVATNLNATVSSRMAESSINTTNGSVDQVLVNSDMIAPDNAGITAIGIAVSELNDFDPANEQVLISGSSIDSIWDESISGHLGVGSVGAALNAAGSAGDPWTTILPGGYGAGTAGQIIGDNIDFQLSTLNNFDPANDEVALVTTVTTNTDMRGTDNANTVEPDNSTVGDTLAIVNAILADTGTDGVAISAAQMNAIADHVLRRGAANVEGSADGDALAFRSLYGAMAKLVNLIQINAGNLEIYQSDDTTLAGAQAVTTDAAAEPATRLDTV